MAALPSGVSATSTSFVSSASLLRINPAPLSRSLMKILNRIGPRIEPWPTLLIIGLQSDLVLLNCYSTAVDTSNAMGHPTEAFAVELNAVKTL